MPKSIVINDKRLRTRSINIDLSSPDRYIVQIIREEVVELDDGRIVERAATMAIVEDITFDENDNPIGDEIVLALIPPMLKAVALLEDKHKAKIAALVEERRNTPVI